MHEILALPFHPFFSARKSVLEIYSPHHPVSCKAYTPHTRTRGSLEEEADEEEEETRCLREPEGWARVFCAAGVVGGGCELVFRPSTGTPAILVDVVYMWCVNPHNALRSRERLRRNL